MLRWPSLGSLFFVCAFWILWSSLSLQAQSMLESLEIQADIDATQISRNLLYSTLHIPVKPGRVSLWYPQYLPGIHGPGYQIQNMGGLEIYTSDNKRLAWERNEEFLYQFQVDVPEGTSSLIVKMTYISNQPTSTSRGLETYGSPLFCAINFQTCLLYPDGKSNRQTLVHLRLKLPESWAYGSALKKEKEESGWVVFESETLEDFIDSPLIAGQFFRTLDLKVKGFPKAYLHLVSESPEALQIDPQLLERYHLLLQQAINLFGYAPFGEYHFLIICSNLIPSLGLEHSSSSLNAIGLKDFLDIRNHRKWAAYLISHEFVHAWCGKYRRPEGMLRLDYHTPQKTSLLWIYEGLTQYLGEILAVRAGLVSTEEYLGQLQSKIESLKNRTGRKWRSLEDTAISAYTLRTGSYYWADLRRDQDYYNEGVLFWMEVDAILRQESQQTKSLDTFCKIFFGPQPGSPKISTYQRKEVIEILQNLIPYDWESLIQKRVRSPMDELSLDFLSRIGYSLKEVSNIPPTIQQKEWESRAVYATASLGMVIAEDGKILEVLPGKTADRVGLFKDMKVTAIDGIQFSSLHFQKSLRSQKPILEFLIQQGEFFRLYQVPGAEGLKYLKLERLLQQPDLLSEILSPH
ncbi:MAG: hypothetical protein AABZ60_07030 [Planctomycetota bacterium]